MIKPALQDEAFLADIQEPLSSLHGFRLWWLGQSGYLVKSHQGSILIDPYLSDSLTLKYAQTDKPHVRVSERVVDPAVLRDIWIVTSSHAHTDHLDAMTLLPLIRNNPDLHFVTTRANLRVAEQRLAGEVDMPLEAGSRIIIDGMAISAVPSAHEKIDRDETGSCLFVGYVFEIGPHRLYHSGDTVLYDGMVEKLRPFNIDIAILPINGRAAERRVAGNLWGREAASLAKEIGAKLVIPCHYDMFEFNTATPDEFVDECQRLGQRYHVLKLGERWSSTELD